MSIILSLQILIHEVLWVLTYKLPINHEENITYDAICFDRNGNYINTISLGELGGIKLSRTFHQLVVYITQTGLPYFYIHEVSIVRDESTIGTIHVFDENGVKIDLGEELNTNVMDLFRLSDGRVFVRTLDEGLLNSSEAKMSLSCICILCSDICHSEVRALAEELMDTFGYTFIGGHGDNDILMTTKWAVYSSNIKGERVKLLNWLDEGVDNFAASMYKNVINIDDTLFTLSYTPSTGGGYGADGKVSIVKLNRANPSDTNTRASRTVISVATLYSDPVIFGAAVNFNRINRDYRVEMKTYSDTSRSWIEADINTFNLDLANGYIPDVVFLARNTPNQSYATRGLFSDLYEFMASDPDFDENDYLDNVFRLLETDGKLYLGTTSFNVNTLVGKASELGDRQSWTWDEYYTFLDSKPGDTLPIGLSRQAISKEDFLTVMLTQRMNDFVDYADGACDFESDAFMRLLRETDKFPQKREDYTVLVDYRTGNPPLLWMPNFTAFYIDTGFYPKIIEYDIFGEKMTYIGFPTDNETQNGSSCSPNDIFAIFENSSNKDGAWEFVKYLLTDFQETAGMGLSNSLQGFPVKKSVLERLATEVKAAELFEEIFSYLLPPTDEEIERILELVYTLEYIDVMDNSILSIVLEEAAAYFHGQKTPEQVAAIIQNRVNLYLSER